MDKTTTSADMDPEVRQFLIRKQVKALSEARGNGTSMISLMIPPRDKVSVVNKMLVEEMGTASCIKSRVNRLSVQSAITSTQNRLKLYNRIPKNGLVIYCGNVVTDQTKERQLTIDFEPFKPIHRFMYLCDSRFHTEPLKELLECSEKFGFIIVDGSGALFGTVSGSTREILHKFAVDLPKKHGRGGQSALRFARLRLEKRHNFLRRVAEVATQVFITNDMPNVSGLILAGLADFKNDLSASDLFDPRLKAVVLKIVDICYGGESGFNQAIDLSADALGDVKLVQEKKKLSTFFEHVATDTGRYSFGIVDTLQACEMGAAEKLLVWENLDLTRYTLVDPTTGEEQVRILSPTQVTESASFVDQKTGHELEVLSTESFVEWLTQTYKKFGATLEFITNKSEEGLQFVRGFGGIGAILRYRVDFLSLSGEEGDAIPEGKNSDDLDDDDDDIDDEYFDMEHPF
ncbi:eukaryotic peptide chain release factor subunit 1 [Pelomyxa schiedti]|nr:eukaryotic peptide chain release factor subunit 1 [Pelomyxa schiedti]